MNIENCPICGGKPLDKWELNYSTGGATQSGQACCGVDCNTNERWNQYAVAMELAIAWDKKRSTSYECEITITNAVKKVLNVFKEA